MVESREGLGNNFAQKDQRETHFNTSSSSPCRLVCHGKKKFNNARLLRAKPVTFQTHGNKDSQRLSNQLPFLVTEPFFYRCVTQFSHQDGRGLGMNDFKGEKTYFGLGFRDFSLSRWGKGGWQQGISRHGNARNKVVE